MALRGVKSEGFNQVISFEVNQSKMLQAIKLACMGPLSPQQLMLRSFSNVTVGSSSAEQGIAEKLQKNFTVLKMIVQDTSGGERGFPLHKSFTQVHPGLGFLHTMPMVKIPSHTRWMSD